MPNNGILQAMRALNKQEDTLTKALDLSLRGVKVKQQALSKAKEEHARREVVFKENVKKIKKRAEELNELLGCSKLLESDDPARHRELLRPVVLQDMGLEDDDEEAEERPVVVRNKAVPRAQRQGSQTRVAEQLKKGRAAKTSAASRLQVQGQTTRMFDKADAAKRARTSRKDVVVHDDEDDSDMTPEAREKRRRNEREPTGSEIEVARVDTPRPGDEDEANVGDDPLHSTADADGVGDSGPHRDEGSSGGGLFNFAAIQARMQTTPRPVNSQRDRSDARRGARAQDPAPQDDEFWHPLGESPEPEIRGRSVEALRDAPSNYAFAGGGPGIVDVNALFDDDAASIASDSSDGLFVGERAPTSSSRGSTPEYMLRASAEPGATRYDEAGSGAHVKGAASSQQRVASRNRFAEAPQLEQPRTTTSTSLPDTQHQQQQQRISMASRDGDRSPTPPEDTERRSGESLNAADVAIPSIEGADEDSIKSEDEDDQIHMEADIDRSEPTGLFSFDKYLPRAQGANQPEPRMRPAYAGPTWQERMYRVSHARDEDEGRNDAFNLPTEELPTSAFSSTVKHSNNSSRLPPPTFSMTSDNDMVAVRGTSSPAFSDGTEHGPGAGFEYKTGEGERESEAAEDPSSDFEATPKAKPKKKATGAKKGARRGPRRAPGTRCAECFRLHRKCTHTDPATGAGDEEDEETADPKYLAMRARKRAAQQMGSYMPPPKRTHYNTYGPDPEPVPATYGQQNRKAGVARGLTFDIGSVIAGKVLGDAKKRKDSEEGTPDRQGTSAKKDEDEGDEEGEDGGENDGNEEQ